MVRMRGFLGSFQDVALIADTNLFFKIVLIKLNYDASNPHQIAY